MKKYENGYEKLPYKDSNGNQKLHYHGTERTSEVKAMDADANINACLILMPKEEFRQVLQQYKGDILKLADRFQVPSLAVVLRYKILTTLGK